MYDVPYDTHTFRVQAKPFDKLYSTVAKWQFSNYKLRVSERVNERACFCLFFAIMLSPLPVSRSTLLSLLIRSVCECLMTHLFEMFVHTSNWNDFFPARNSHICLCEHDRLAFCRMFVFNRWGVGNAHRERESEREHEHPLPWNKQQLFRWKCMKLFISHEYQVC